MSEQRRTFLRDLMALAWRVYRQRHIPGCNVSTFADAMRNAWAWVKRQADPVAAGPHLRLRSMLQSPIRRSLIGPYANRRAGELGYVTSMMGR